MATGTAHAREEHNAPGAPGGTQCPGAPADTGEHATGAPGEHTVTGTRADPGLACHWYAPGIRATRRPTCGGQATELRALCGLERITSPG